MIGSLLVLLLLVGSVNAQNTYTVTADIDNATPYLGQQVVYRVRFYAEAVPDYTYVPPDFEGWWRGEQLTSVNPEVIDGKSYVVTTIETILYPLQTGILTIEPAQIVLPETVFSDRVEFTTESVRMQVLALPLGAPDGFNGGVGRFEAEISVDKPTAVLGEPVMLQYRINGSGNLAQLTPPKLFLPEGWRAYPNPSALTNQTRGFGERVFEWRLIPERVGSHTFPAQPFAYFDPEFRAYQSSQLAAFTLDVLPTADGLRELPTFNRTRVTVALELKPVPDTLTNESSSASVLLWTVPPLMVALVWSGVQFFIRRKAYLAAMRQVNALKQAKTRLQSARKSQSFRLVQEAIGGYFADKLNHNEKILVGAMLDEKLPDDTEVIKDCLLQAEEGRYAPTGVVSLDAVVAQTITALTNFDKYWKPDAQ